VAALFKNLDLHPELCIPATQLLKILSASSIRLASPVTASVSNSSRYVRSWPTHTPSSRAGWDLGSSLNAARRTASSLNSRVNLLRGFYSIEHHFKSVLLQLRCPSDVGNFSAA
jgi:hypothetical protein